MSKLYAVYDMKYYEQCIGVYEKVEEIAKLFNMGKDSVLLGISKKCKIKHRYLVERIRETEEYEEKENPIKTKSEREIFQELIDAFALPKVEFPIFDEFKWQLKGIKDKVIVDEEWKTINDFHYSISNYGRFRNDKNGKLKSPRYHRWILQVDIYENGKRYTCDVARMVANYFIGEVDKNKRVRHIDGDIRNNYYKNLEIVSK